MTEHKAISPWKRYTGGRIQIPSDVERTIGEPVPCFLCGVRGDCRHRVAS
jgi:hypothetical protein